MRKADPARGLRCGVTAYWPRLMPGLPSSQEATANVVDPPMRTWLADTHPLDQRLKGPELSIDLAKRASGRQLEPGSE